MTTWRVHCDGKDAWRYCTDTACPETHHLYRPFIGVDPEPITETKATLPCADIRVAINFALAVTVLILLVVIIVGVT